ncbi:UDP-N-acetylmuramate dehydrogenase [Pseudomonas sp. ICMP 460]|uniref:UDP-N-acetylmuramate dehydrogenase n=1 Tax=Pseudomonas sp. ICMP 460 TaxID=1718917 RepID=UPI000C08744F|nr:UDP-N-acetylmuramate dehydrogenase [Pseudomonas sp. ICMP 460]PHN20248.1 UDP-N-acetylenolpyruvoylglucosamine reductase [Pseudomonas sp. ICMP 460]
MSLHVLAQVSLKPFNSFGIDVRAQWFAEARSDAEVREALAYAAAHASPLLVIGGGSNLLLTQDIQALVVRMATQGIRVLQDDGLHVVVEAEAGEAWHPFVLWTLEHGFCGLENLSLIPGTVGAAPMQNIGAYGVEIKDVFAGLTALDRQTGELRDFSLAECNFAYRDSLFKHETGRWLILRVRFALSRVSHLKLDYGPVQQRLAGQGITQATPSDVSRAICSIRREKLPDPAELGNAGSFFKNPLVSTALAAELQAKYPDLVAYPQPDGQMKLAAGWLIDKAGWKGFREGDAGVHKMQALVLVNYGAATGQDIANLARRIQQDIAQRFKVTLEMEPNQY